MKWVKSESSRSIRNGDDDLTREPSLGSACSLPFHVQNVLQVHAGNIRSP